MIEVRGNDRTQFLHSFCTNDVKKLVPGQGCEAFVTNHQGKIVGHGFIFCESERLVMGTVAGQAAALIAHFDRFVISEDVTVPRPVRPGADLPRRRRHRCRNAAHVDQLRAAGGNAELQPPHDRRLRLHAIPRAVLWCRFLLHPRCQRRRRHRASALEDAGARLCQAEAVQAKRIEAGFPYFSRDITDENLPQEVGRDQQAISFTKGCYLGQETVARIDALGHVNKMLAGVRFQATEIPPPGTRLLAGDKEVGHVASACFSASLQAPLALAYVRRLHAKTGSNLESDLGPAEVIALPLR